ncbi:MAG: DMT family transporter [Candidatus Aenigmatarchaeota archaeon]
MDKASALKHGLLFAALSPIFSSIATIFQAGAAKALNPLIVTSAGGILGGAILLAMLLVTEKRKVLAKAGKNSKDIAKMTLLRPVLGVLTFALGLAMTDAIKAIFFTKVEPYFVLVAHWVARRERVYARQLGLLAVHIAGAVMLSTGGVPALGIAQLGDIFVVLAMALFAASYIYAARLSKSIGARMANGITMLVGGLVILPFALALSPPAAWDSALGWKYLIGYALLFNVIGLTLWFAALKTVKSWIVSALRAIGPIAGAPVAFLMFGETLTAIQLAGAAIVLATAALIAREHKVHKRRPERRKALRN